MSVWSDVGVGRVTGRPCGQVVELGLGASQFRLLFWRRPLDRRWLRLHHQYKWRRVLRGTIRQRATLRALCDGAGHGALDCYSGQPTIMDSHHYERHLNDNGMDRLISDTRAERLPSVAVCWATALLSRCWHVHLCLCHSAGPGEPEPAAVAGGPRRRRRRWCRLLRLGPARHPQQRQVVQSGESWLLSRCNRLHDQCQWLLSEILTAREQTWKYDNITPSMVTYMK